MPRNTRHGGDAGRDPQPPTLSYQWAGPQRDRPRRTPSHTLPTSGTLKPPQKQTSSLGWTEPPSVGTPPGYREPTKPGPHLQPLRVPGRVASSSNTESIVDTEEEVPLVSSDGATASPAGSRPARLPRSPPPPTQLLFGLRRRRWNSNRSGRHLSRSFFLRKRGGVAEARAVKPTGLARRPGREALAGRHIN